MEYIKKFDYPSIQTLLQVLTKTDITSIVSRSTNTSIDIEIDWANSSSSLDVNDNFDDRKKPEDRFLIFYSSVRDVHTLDFVYVQGSTTATDVHGC